MAEENILVKQQQLWALHAKSTTTEVERREIERRLQELEKRKPKDTVLLSKDGFEHKEG